MAYKALIFDLDGTLLDTLADIGNAMNRTLAKEGFPIHPLEAYRYFVGDGVTMLVTRALPPESRNPATIQRCLQVYRTDFNQNWNIQTRPYAGIPEMLDALVKREVKMAILTNKPYDFTQLCVAEFLSPWKFEMVIGERADLPKKPDPTGALEIARRFQLPPSEILYLGDTAVDMQTARAAHIVPVGVLWGFRPREELQASGAQVLLNQPLEILSLLEEY